MTTQTAKADPIVEFLDHVLSGICRDRAIVIRERSRIFVETSPREFPIVLGARAKMWEAIKTCVFHACRLEKIDPVLLVLNTPDERGQEYAGKAEYSPAWDREAFLEYIAPIVHSVAPNTPECRYAQDDGESAKIVSVWDAEGQEWRANLAASLAIIFDCAGKRIGARIAFEVQWK